MAAPERVAPHPLHRHLLIILACIAANALACSDGVSLMKRIGACNVSCCGDDTCDCYKMTQKAMMPNPDVTRWCIWTFCVDSAFRDCPTMYTEEQRRLKGEVVSWWEECQGHLDTHGCGIVQYTHAYDCLNKADCWDERATDAYCEERCVKQSLACFDKYNCRGGTAGMSKLCRSFTNSSCENMCGDCLENTCTALYPDQGSDDVLQWYHGLIIAVGVLILFIFLIVMCRIREHYKRPRENMMLKSESQTQMCTNPRLSEDSQPMSFSQGTSTPLSHQDLTSAIRSHQWQRGKLLGRGQFGAVYLAVLPQGHVIAVKQMDATSLSIDSDARAAYLREVEAMRDLDHPYIIRYYGAHLDVERRMVNLFMEYVPGGTLARLVRSMPIPLEEKAAKVYIRQILLGVEYLHSHNIIHRDIKGDNVLVNFSLGTVKITDFGSSRQISRTVDTHCATLAGTPNWMAPEVITSHSMKLPHKEKIDVWSIGCTTVELLNSGRPPWPVFESQWAAIYHIANATGTPEGIPDDISEDCRDFILHALVIDPVQRASVSDLLTHPWLGDAEANFKIEGVTPVHDTILSNMVQEWKKMSARERAEAIGRDAGDSQDVLALPFVSSVRHHSIDLSIRQSRASAFEDAEEGPHPFEVATHPSVSTVIYSGNEIPPTTPNAPTMVQDVD